MSRPLRLLTEGAIYHVMSRGNAKMAIYHDDVDRLRFLAILEGVLEQYRVECHAYCLMSNHYHMVLRTLDANLSSAIRQLNGVYAQWWNRRHQRVGHMVQGRFKAQLVERDGYFLEVCRYVVLNPVRSGLVTSPEEWPWSSYAATAGLVPRQALLTVDLVLGSRPGPGPCRAYRAFIAAGMRGSAMEAAIRSDARIIGTEEFVAAHRADVELAHPTEIPHREKRIGRTSLQLLFEGVSDKRDRNRRIREARTRYHYDLAAIAAHLGLHYSSVSRIASTSSRDHLSSRAPSGSANPDLWVRS
jgi:putative transposase